MHRHAFSDGCQVNIYRISCYQLSTVHGSVRGAYYMSSHEHRGRPPRRAARGRARPFQFSAAVILARRRDREREPAGRGAGAGRVARPERVTVPSVSGCLHHLSLLAVYGVNALSYRDSISNVSSVSDRRPDPGPCLDISTSFRLNNNLMIVTSCSRLISARSPAIALGWVQRPARHPRCRCCHTHARARGVNGALEHRA